MTLDLQFDPSGLYVSIYRIDSLQDPSSTGKLVLIKVILANEMGHPCSPSYSQD